MLCLVPIKVVEVVEAELWLGKALFDVFEGFGERIAEAVPPRRGHIAVQPGVVVPLQRSQFVERSVVDGHYRGCGGRRVVGVENMHLPGLAAARPEFVAEGGPLHPELLIGQRLEELDGARVEPAVAHHGDADRSPVAIFGAVGRPYDTERVAQRELLALHEFPAGCHVIVYHGVPERRPDLEDGAAVLAVVAGRGVEPQALHRVGRMLVAEREDGEGVYERALRGAVGDGPERVAAGDEAPDCAHIDAAACDKARADDGVRTVADGVASGGLNLRACVVGELYGDALQTVAVYFSRHVGGEHCGLAAGHDVERGALCLAGDGSDIGLYGEERCASDALGGDGFLAGSERHTEREVALLVGCGRAAVDDVPATRVVEHGAARHLVAHRRALHAGVGVGEGVAFDLHRVACGKGAIRLAQRHLECGPLVLLYFDRRVAPAVGLEAECARQQVGRQREHGAVRAVLVALRILLGDLLAARVVEADLDVLGVDGLHLVAEPAVDYAAHLHALRGAVYSAVGKEAVDGLFALLLRLQRGILPAIAQRSVDVALIFRAEAPVTFDADDDLALAVGGVGGHELRGAGAGVIFADPGAAERFAAAGVDGRDACLSVRQGEVDEPHAADIYIRGKGSVFAGLFGQDQVNAALCGGLPGDAVADMEAGVGLDGICAVSYLHGPHAPEHLRGPGAALLQHSDGR